MPDAGRISQHKQLELAIEDERPIIVFTECPSLTDKKPKTILGKTDNFDADGVLDHLVAQPAHAKFLMAKLWSHFVYPEPEAKLVDQLAKVYVAGKYEIKPVLRWIANSKEFWSEKAVRGLVKSPVHYTIPIARQLQIGKRLKDAGSLGQVGLLPQDKRANDYARGLVGIMRRQGMFLFYPPDVAGWAWDSAWITTASVIERNKIGAYLFTVGSGSPAIVMQALREKQLADTTAVVDFLTAWFDIPANADAKKLMTESLDANGGMAAFQKTNTAATALQAFWRLASALPAYQMR
jgi:uncharacterized protein (DUF1800 family)